LGPWYFGLLYQLRQSGACEFLGSVGSMLCVVGETNFLGPQLHGWMGGWTDGWLDM